MLRKMGISAAMVSVVLLSGCASVPMAPKDMDMARKAFAVPASQSAGLYIYRDSMLGAALKKTLYLDGQVIGETASKTYFYKEVAPGKHTISTESEFGNNDVSLDTEAGKNYYVNQQIKMGVVTGGAKLVMVDDEVGKKGVQACKLAK